MKKNQKLKIQEIGGISGEIQKILKKLTVMKQNKMSLLNKLQRNNQKKNNKNNLQKKLL